MNNTISSSVLIFGSCVSRDVLSIPEAQGLTIADYYARSSLGALLAKPWDQPAVLGKIASNFQRRVVRADMEKTFLHVLPKLEADVFMLDLIDERFNMLTSVDGKRITLSSEYCQGAGDALEGRIIPHGSEEHFTLWCDGVTHLLSALHLQDRLQSLRILEVYWAKETVHGNKFETYSPDFSKIAHDLVGN